MAQYELMSIIRPDLDDEHVESAVESLTNIVTQSGGTIEQVDKWGKRHLSYPIEGHPDGYYVVVSFNGKGPISNEIMRVLNLTEAVMRSIVVRTDPD
ncbi:MAG: 30S ribosomal protein S6 [Firmicutes bacterium]|nr:30S ribosomal protein S6 [Bacillota bacterium]